MAKKVANEKIFEALKILKEASKEKRVELGELISDLYEKAKDTGEDAAGSAKDAMSDVDKSVHKKPWLYIGGAAIFGFLAGLFFRSRR